VRTAMMSVAVLAVVASPALAAVGETWILPIHHRDGGGWTEYPGAGYEGTSAWEGRGWDGVRRAYWELSGTGSMGNEPPEEVSLYTIEVWAPTSGATQWQPIESQLHGIIGETHPMEPGIPWAGQYGTNHQWIGSDGYNDGQWHQAGPGPQVPNSPDFYAPGAAPDSFYMWLKRGSWMYAKWDFGWPITRAWSVLRLTQITSASPSAGACCLIDGSCLDDTTPAECADLRGTHQWYGTTCDQVQCPEATGACCLPDSSVCAEMTGSECTMLGGDFRGYNTTCAEKWAECCHDPFADADGDTDVDQDDFGVFQACFTGANPSPGAFDPEMCRCLDLDENSAVDEDDYGAFELCASGPDVPADASCDDGLPLP